MFLSRRPKGAEFETDIEFKGPSDEEIDYFAVYNQRCNYYYLGLAKCRDTILEKSYSQDPQVKKYGFQPCKQLVDAHFSCMTNKRAGRIVLSRFGNRTCSCAKGIRAIL